LLAGKARQGYRHADGEPLAPRRRDWIDAAPKPVFPTFDGSSAPPGHRQSPPTGSTARPQGDGRWAKASATATAAP